MEHWLGHADPGPHACTDKFALCPLLLQRNERPDPRGEPPSRASGEGRRWGEKAPADNWRAGGPGGKDHRDWRDERGGHNGGRGGERERERELRPRGRWEENEAWGDKRRGNDRPNKDGECGCLRLEEGARRLHPSTVCHTCLLSLSWDPRTSHPQNAQQGQGNSHSLIQP